MNIDPRPGSVTAQIVDLKAVVEMMKARIIENGLQHLFTPEEKQQINSVINKR